MDNALFKTNAKNAKDSAQITDKCNDPAASWLRPAEELGMKRISHFWVENCAVRYAKAGRPLVRFGSKADIAFTSVCPLWAKRTSPWLLPADRCRASHHACSTTRWSRTSRRQQHAASTAMRSACLLKASNLNAAGSGGTNAIVSPHQPKIDQVTNR